MRPTDPSPNLQAALEALAGSLRKFQSGNRSLLFDARDRLRAIMDEVHEARREHVKPLLAIVQSLLNTILRKTAPTEEESVLLLAGLVDCVRGQTGGDETPAPLPSKPMQLGKIAVSVQPNESWRHSGRKQTGPVRHHEEGGDKVTLHLDEVAESLLGKILLRCGYITTTDLNRALGLQQVCRRRLGEVHVTMGVLDEMKLQDALARQRAMTLEISRGLHGHPGGLELRLARDLDGGDRPRAG